MGIYDRDYVRRAPPTRGPMGRPGGMSITLWLIIINVGVFLLANVFLQSWKVRSSWGTERFDTVTVNGRTVTVTDAVRERETVLRQQVLPHPTLYLVEYNPIVATIEGSPVPIEIGRERFYSQQGLQAFGHFSTAKGFLQLEVWRLLTFQFLHADLTHLFFNMFGLFMFGSLVEQFLGRRRYLAFYLMCGICGGLMYQVLNLLGATGLQVPGVLINDVYTPLIGASAGVFGVLMAAAFVAPNSTVLLFFVVPVKMRTFAYGFAALAALNLFMAGNNAGGDAAHLGGAIAGFYFIRRSHLLRDFFDVLGPSKSPAPRNPPGPSEREIDRILDKYNSQGLEGLTDKEKRTLRRATEARRGG